jgi:hypothetical protein
MLPGLFINKAYNYLELGNKDEIITYFALAYYGSEIVEKPNNQEKVKDYVNEKLNITFE